MVTKILFHSDQTLYMCENEQLKKSNSITFRYAYFQFPRNIAQYGYHVTYGSHWKLHLSDRLFAADEIKILILIKTRMSFKGQGVGVARKKLVW